VDKLYVIEELDPFLENHCKALGLSVIGKELFPICGEFSQSLVREKLLGEKPDPAALEEALPGRPPVMCAGCPHRGVFYALNRLKTFVSGDIGCYTLGASAPLSALDTTICMGASISGAHGAAKAVGKLNGKLPVAVIGDSTFIHSGVTGLINVAYNQAATVTIILDNSITGMTGHQQNPTTGYTLQGDPTAAVDLEALCRAVGIKNICVCDPYDLPGTLAIIKAAVEGDEAAVIISRRPCALLKTVKHNPALMADQDKCTGCKACLRIGCPAISMKADDNGKPKMEIDRNQCVGCGQCVSLCAFSAIGGHS
jgi:indolepyruvate ferredoxin oxidoreductase alpha subunit